MSDLPRLFLLTDRSVRSRAEGLLAHLGALLQAAQPGTVGVLLRDKGLEKGERRRLGKELRALTHRSHAPLVVHGDSELARDLGAEGLHLPDSLRSLSEARRSFGGQWLGRSCHDPEGLARAASEGASYAFLSPVRPSPDKAEPGQELGWDAFAHMSQAFAQPVYALGGMGPDDAAEAKRRGAWGLAGIRAFLQVDDPAEAIRKTLRPWGFAPLLAFVLHCSALTACQNQPTGDDDDDSAAVGGDDDSAPDPIDIPRPEGSFGLECPEQEPNDLDISPDTNQAPSPPWTGVTDCGVLSEGSSNLLLYVYGSIADVVQGAWSGDSDAFVFETDHAFQATAVLRWDPLVGDYDVQLHCPSGSGYTEVFSNDLATTAIPETAATTAAIEAGSRCYLLVVGYAGPVADYEFWLESWPPSGDEKTDG